MDQSDDIGDTNAQINMNILPKSPEKYSMVNTEGIGMQGHHLNAFIHQKESATLANALHVVALFFTRGSSHDPFHSRFGSLRRGSVDNRNYSARRLCATLHKCAPFMDAVNH